MIHGFMNCIINIQQFAFNVIDKHLIIIKQKTLLYAVFSQPITITGKQPFQKKQKKNTKQQTKNKQIKKATKKCFNREFILYKRESTLAMNLLDLESLEWIGTSSPVTDITADGWIDVRWSLSRGEVFSNSCRRRRSVSRGFRSRPNTTPSGTSALAMVERCMRRSAASSAMPSMSSFTNTTAAPVRLNCASTVAGKRWPIPG
jgi:hypothetical protein